MTKTVRILLIALLALALCFAAIIVFGRLRAQRRAAEAQAGAAALERAEAEALIEEREEWLEREAWMERLQPRFPSRSEADRALLGAAERAAAARGAKIQNTRLLKLDDGATGRRAGVELTATGDLAALAGWSHDLLRPEMFREVQRFSLRPSGKDDPQLLRCELRLIQWWREEGGDG